MRPLERVGVGSQPTGWPLLTSLNSGRNCVGGVVICVSTVVALPVGTAGLGATPEGGWDGRVHPNPPRCLHGASKQGGRSQPRPRRPDRHRRSGGRGATASTATTSGIDVVYVRSAISVHMHPDMGRTLVDRLRERRKPPPNHGPPHRHRQALAPRSDASPTTTIPPPRACHLAEKTALRELSFAQIVQSINREESNDGTHETKAALLRRRRVGPEPGEDLPRPQDRPLPDRVARERSQAEPVAQTSRLGAREAAGGSVRRRVHRRAERQGRSQARAAHAGEAL